MCLPKERGGLGIKDINTFNLALLGKWKLHLLQCQGDLWARVLESKYGGWRGGEEGGSPRTRAPSSSSLESIPESEVSRSGEHMEVCNEPHVSRDLEEEKNIKNQQEYFVPWHLPYHRAEISGASAEALAAGLATKDDNKGAVVYNRYYHVFSEGELER